MGRGETRDEHSKGRWRGEEVQEEDAAMTIQRTGEKEKERKRRVGMVEEFE